MDSKYRASSFQYFTLVTGGIIANGIMTLPRAVAAHAGRDAWLVVLVTGCLMTLAALLLHVLASFYPDKDPSQWAVIVLGPLFGRIWLLLLAVKCIFFTYITAKLYAGILSVRILVYTPKYVTAIAIILLTFLASQAFLRGLARYSELAFFFKVMLVPFLIVPLILGRGYHLAPVLVETPLPSLVRAMPPSIFSYIGLEILWFIYPYLKNKSGYLPIVSLGYTTVIYVLTTISATLFFGPERLQTLLVPTLSMLSIIQLAVLERIDSLFLWLWVGTVTVTTATQFYIAARAIQGVLPTLHFRKICGFLTGVLLISVIPVVALPTLYKWADRLGMVDIAVVVGGSVLCMAITLIRSGGVRSG